MTPTGLWRPLARGLRALFRRSAADRELADEVQHYLDQAAAAHRARGLSAAAALRAARLELGPPASVREQVRASGWEHAVETILIDIRYAARRLRAAPGFTLVAVLTLGVGIGAATAIFSAVKPILFDPLPYPAADRLTMIWEGSRDGTKLAGTFGSYRAVEERVRSIDAVAVMKNWQPTVTGGDRPERLEGQSVSASYFETLGVGPALGPGFLAADDHPGGPPVVVLSDALWRRRFAADRSIIGRAIRLDGRPYAVVGVMPAGFENVLAPAAQIWTLLQYGPGEGRAWGHHLRTVARLGAGVGLDQARGELGRLAPDLVRMAAAANGFFPGEFAVVALRDEVAGGVREVLWAVIGAVLLVLMIACVNVTNLLLARGAHRRGELAVRTTLGAGRARLVRQLLTESLLLATLGGLAGLAVAAAGIRALVAHSPAGLPRVAAIGLDGTVFGFGLALTTLVGLAFGLIPALEAAGRNPHEGVQWASRRTIGGHRRTRSALVVAEVALALVILVSSGLLLRSLNRLLAVDPGFDSSSLLTMQVKAVATTPRFFDEALERIRRLPGVTAAGLVNQLPLSGDRDEYGAHFEAGPTEAAKSYNVFRYAVSPGYLETMRIALRRGRLLDPGDRAGAPLSVLISESLARRAVPAGDPIGRRLRIGPATGPLYTVVGVVGDVRQASLGLTDAEAVYTTAAQWWAAEPAMSLVIRTERDPAGLAAAARDAIWSVDPDQAVVRVATMTDLVAASAAERRFALTLFEAFALSALVLAAAGIYGVMSASVAERTREIGVRSALGASRAATLAMVVRQGMTLTGLGAGLGLIGAVVATRSIGAMLFGVSRLDLVTYLGMTAILAMVGLVACGIPAWRAARVDPATTLRTE